MKDVRALQAHVQRARAPCPQVRFSPYGPVTVWAAPSPDARTARRLIYSLIADEVAGYVMYSWPSSLYACITKLAVKESYKGERSWEALLKAAIEKCRTRKIYCVSLHVDPLRTAAMNLYKKLGFQVDSLVESYYSAGREAYRMCTWILRQIS